MTTLTRGIYKRQAAEEQQHETEELHQLAEEPSQVPDKTAVLAGEARGGEAEDSYKHRFFWKSKKEGGKRGTSHQYLLR